MDRAAAYWAALENSPGWNSESSSLDARNVGEQIPPVSPCAKWLNTNYVPTLSEASQIRTLMSTSSAEIDSLSKAMKAHLEIAKALRLRKEAAEKHVAEHAALLSPARRLPSDTLRDIFLACLPTNYNAIMSCKEAPLLLSLVCKGWREIVLSTPRLWSSLHIAIPADSGTYDTRHDGLKLWLSRSGGCALSITVAQCASSKEHWEALFTLPPHAAQLPGAPAPVVVTKGIHGILSTIVAQAKRLQSLELHLSLSTTKQLGRELASVGGLPVLSTLRLLIGLASGGNLPIVTVPGWSQGESSNSDEVVQIFFEAAPVLSKLLFSGSNFFSEVGDIAPMLSPAWERLTKLDLSMTPMSCASVLSTLARCPNLTKCAISMTPDIDDSVINMGIFAGFATHLPPAPTPKAPLQTVSLEHLTDLGVIAQTVPLSSMAPGDTDTLKLFQNLQAPALTNLYFDEYHPRSMYRSPQDPNISLNNQDSATLPFIPFETLRKVSVKGVPFSEKLILELLRQTPLLTSLELINPDTSLGSTVVLINPAEDNTTENHTETVSVSRLVVQCLRENLDLVPNLTTLKIVRSTSLTVPEIIDLARARSPKAGGQLNHIIVGIHTVETVHSLPQRLSRVTETSTATAELWKLQLEKIFDEETVFAAITFTENKMLVRLDDSVWTGVDQLDMPDERRAQGPNFTDEMYAGMVL